MELFGTGESEVYTIPDWDWAGSDDGPELWIGSGLSPIYTLGGRQVYIDIYVYIFMYWKIWAYVLWPWRGPDIRSSKSMILHIYSLESSNERLCS